MLNLTGFWIFYVSLWAGVVTTEGRSDNSPRLWTLNEFPNPMLDPKACGRVDVQHSALCDPDHLMATRDQDVVEMYMNNVTIAEVAAVLIHGMHWKTLSSGVESAAEIFARGLHDKWGVGNKKTQNGVLIFISSSDRVVYISVGDGVKGKLNDQNLDKVINRMKPHLKGGKFDAAFVSAVLDIVTLLTKNGKISSASNDNSSLVQPWIIVAVIVGMMFCLGVKKERERTQLERGRKSLESLITDVKNAKHMVYMCSSCPMCLEPFAADEQIQQRRDGNNDTTGLIVPKSLPCGHVFCDNCIKEYLKVTAKATCPICRESIRHLDGDSMSTGEFEPPRASYDSEQGRTVNPYRQHMQMILFRTRRMRVLHPTVFDTNTHSVIDAAVHSGCISDAVSVVESRAKEIDFRIMEMKLSSSSSKGSSRSSFGGGRSSGGRGGRW